MEKTRGLTGSQEDYLEAIFHIVSKKQAARATDIAKRLNVKRSSVTGALRLLAEKGLINYAPYDVVTLTEEGWLLAEDVVRRHEVLRDFFVKVLGIDTVEAEKGACELEHAVSRPILNKLIQFVEFIEVCPRAGLDWVKAFEDYCRGTLKEESCISCTFQRLEELKERRGKGTKVEERRLSVWEMVPGQKGRIVKVKGRKEFQKNVVEMGLRRGSVLEVEKLDAHDDHIEIKVRGYHRSLRREEAEKVIAEVI